MERSRSWKVLGTCPGKGKFVHNPLDESSELGLDPWPAKALWVRSKAPEQSKADPVPGDNGFWFDDDQRFAP
jgi:hypothetical protein